MVLERIGPLSGESPALEPRNVPQPVPGPVDLLISVSVCGVCRTELDEIEGRSPPPRLPVIPGHQVVGRVSEMGDAAGGEFSVGDRVGVAWIHGACGGCAYCRSGRENLCQEFVATGRDVNGGYAEFMTVPAAFAHTLPPALPDHEAAPLLCAGAIGLRALRLTGLEDGQVLGLTGFGSSAHLVLMLAKHLLPSSKVFVFARRAEDRAFALSLGADWAGETEASPPEPPTAVIDTTPAWTPVVQALRHLAPGGRLVVNALSKDAGDRDALGALDYASDLWMEKEVKSVANVTRDDVRSLLAIAAKAGIRPQVVQRPLEEANEALAGLASGATRGATVLRVAPETDSTWG